MPVIGFSTDGIESGQDNKLGKLGTATHFPVALNPKAVKVFLLDKDLT